MLSCEEVARLVSESLDRHLSLSERTKMKIHHLVCSTCKKHQKQILFLQKALQRFCSDDSGVEFSEADLKLSEEGKLRIKEALNNDS
ncbi:zf-HC2 domain-containing protein [bacterium]|jgi:hypothetical protein|nr:zf-HC2 domain-containing protein [bacterium]